MMQFLFVQYQGFMRNLSHCPRMPCPSIQFVANEGDKRILSLNHSHCRVTVTVNRCNSQARHGVVALSVGIVPGTAPTHAPEMHFGLR